MVCSASLRYKGRLYPPCAHDPCRSLRSPPDCHDRIATSPSTSVTQASLPLRHPSVAVPTQCALTTTRRTLAARAASSTTTSNGSSAASPWRRGGIAHSTPRTRSNSSGNCPPMCSLAPSTALSPSSNTFSTQSTQDPKSMTRRHAGRGAQPAAVQPPEAGHPRGAFLTGTLGSRFARRSGSRGHAAPWLLSRQTQTHQPHSRLARGPQPLSGCRAWPSESVWRGGRAGWPRTRIGNPSQPTLLCRLLRP